jgi:hypothetical protein
MQLSAKRSGDQLNCAFNLRTAGIITQCINEIANGIDIDDDEFETRVGDTRSNVKLILDQLLAAIRS